MCYYSDIIWLKITHVLRCAAALMCKVITVRESPKQQKVSYLVVVHRLRGDAAAVQRAVGMQWEHELHCSSALFWLKLSEAALKLAIA